MIPIRRDQVSSMMMCCCGLADTARHVDWCRVVAEGIQCTQGTTVDVTNAVETQDRRCFRWSTCTGGKERQTVRRCRIRFGVELAAYACRKLNPQLCMSVN